MMFEKTKMYVLAAAMVALGGCAADVGEGPIATAASELGGACSDVYCLWYPTCEEGQHLVQNPQNCCGTCVGRAALANHCAYVRCAEPQCGDGQHVLHQGPQDCCGTCVGNTTTLADSCATVLCAAVVCSEGEELVHLGPTDCCGTCVSR